MTFDPQDLRACSRAKGIGCEIEVHDVLPSTMDEAAAAGKRGAPHGYVAIARQQTAGRGSHGRSWESASDDLQMSVLLRVSGWPIAAISSITLAAGLAVAETLESMCDCPMEVKWPNDVHARGKKICGILAESVSQGPIVETCVVGIGVNVNRTEFSQHLSGATSLRNILGSSLAISEVLPTLLGTLDTRLHPDGLQEGGWLESLNERLAYRGQNVTLDGKPFGELLGLSEDGHAMTQLDPKAPVLHHHVGRLRLADEDLPSGR